MCDWSILSPLSLLAATLLAFSAPPFSLLALPSPLSFIYKYSPLSAFCLCMYVPVCTCRYILALSCRPGRTPNGKRFYHYVWLAISLHISSTIADKAYCSIALLPLRPSMQRHMYSHRNTNTIAVAHFSELSVRTDVATIIESGRDGAVRLPSEDILSTEHH